MASFDELKQAARINFADQFRQVTGKALKLGGQNLRDTVKAYTDLAKNKSALAKINGRLAESMQDAMITAYHERVNEGHSYRKGDRYTGRLLPALQSPSMAVGTSSGIGFIDETLLNKVAGHWKRLNFGAGGAGDAWPKQKARIQFGSGQSVALEIIDEGKRRAFDIPERIGVGYFINRQARTAGGQFASGLLARAGEFYPGIPPKGKRVAGRISIVRRRPTAGIAARRFTDAGFVALAQNFGPAYTQHFQEAQRKAAAKSRTKRIRPVG